MGVMASRTPALREFDFGALEGKQKAMAHQVLRTMLSATGFAKAMAISDPIRSPSITNVSSKPA